MKKIIASLLTMLVLITTTLTCYAEEKESICGNYSLIKTINPKVFGDRSIALCGFLSSKPPHIRLNGVFINSTNDFRNGIRLSDIKQAIEETEKLESSKYVIINVVVF